MTYHDGLPEEGNEENAYLISALGNMYQTGNEDAQSLSHIRERLLRTGEETVHGTSREANANPYQVQTNRIPGKMTIPSRRRGWQRRISIIAALIIVSLLVGSMLLLFSTVRSTLTGSGGQGHATKSNVVVLQPTYTGNSTPTTSVTANPPLAIPDKNWKGEGRFNGTGPKTINGLHIMLTATWGLLYNCQGTGSINIRLNADKTQVGGPYCINRVFELSDGTQTTLVTSIHVLVGTHTKWEILLIGCANTLPHCGTTIQPAVPTVTPQPTQP